MYQFYRQTYAFDEFNEVILFNRELSGCYHEVVYAIGS